MGMDFSVAGLLVGFAVGLTGIGGGALMTPILMLYFGIPATVAVGTDLLYAAITKTSGVWVHTRHRTIDWRIIRHLATGSIPAALLTLVALQLLQRSGHGTDHLITGTLSVALVLTASVVLLRYPLRWYVQDERPLGLRIPDRWRVRLTVLGGAVVGVLVTLTSVGAGALGTTLLFLLYPRMPARSIVGTELAHAVPLTLLAGLGHMHMGTTDLALLGWLLLGSLPGVYLGSRLCAHLPDTLLRPTLAGILLVVGVRLAL